MASKKIPLDFTKTLARDSHGRWKKGQSGNPNGRRRKLPQELIDLFASNTDTAVKRIIALMDSPDPKISLEATKFCIEKGLGKNFQAFEDAKGEEDISNDIVINIKRAMKDSEE